jgi:hypothetical protein
MTVTVTVAIAVVAVVTVGARDTVETTRSDAGTIVVSNVVDVDLTQVVAIGRHDAVVPVSQNRFHTSLRSCQSFCRAAYLQDASMINSSRGVSTDLSCPKMAAELLTTAIVE